MKHEYVRGIGRSFREHPNVKAVIVVHLYGISANMDRIVISKNTMLL